MLVIAGDILIWYRVSGALLHHIRAQDGISGLTCIAWNAAAEEPFMLCTGHENGAIRVWLSLLLAVNKDSPLEGDASSEMTPLPKSDVEYPPLLDLAPEANH